MKCFKSLVVGLFAFVMLISVAFGVSYNENGDFALEVASLKKTTFNDNIEAVFSLSVKNNLNSNQRINLDISEVEGWDIVVVDTSFVLKSGETRDVQIDFKANSRFNYGQSVVGPDVVVISQKESYFGTFEFPVLVSGENEDVSLVYALDIKQREVLEEVFSIEFSTGDISPEKPFGFVVKGDNIVDNQDVTIITEIGDSKFEKKDVFTSKNYYKVYQQEIPTSIEPGPYKVMVTVRVVEGGENSRVIDWQKEAIIEVDEYKSMIVANRTEKTLFKNKYFFDVINTGNTENVFVEDFEFGFFNSLIFSTTEDEDNYETNVDGVHFEVPLERGESKVVELEFNYIPVYIILIVIVVLVAYIYHRKNSNPLDVETKIYEIKTVAHEGIKSMKVRIGFENIHEHEIEKLSLKFRMPSYLKVQENSFLLTEPNKILKGTNEYKLVWDFKRFEKNDSRILGFSLVNSRGILGDIKMPNLEIEISSKGKIRKYYKSFPTIKG